MSRRRQQTAPVEAGSCDCMRVQDTSGVQREARGDSQARNRRDPTPQPSSGKPGAYKVMPKSRRAGRESEGFVVPLTMAAITPFEGRDPALVAHDVEVSVRAWPSGPTTPSQKHENSSTCSSRQPSTAVARSRGGAAPSDLTTRPAAMAQRAPD